MEGSRVLDISGVTVFQMFLTTIAGLCLVNFLQSSGILEYLIDTFRTESAGWFMLTLFFGFLTFLTEIKRRSST